MNIKDLMAKYDEICQRLTNPSNASIYNDWNTKESEIPDAYETRILLQKVRDEIAMLKEHGKIINQQGTLPIRIQECSRMLDKVSHLLDTNGFA